jgi:ribosomal protein S18 acetylase RimI-like enzyme
MASDPSFSVRIAKESDRARLVPLINAAFSIETFLEGSRTDGTRLAADMEKGTILVAEDAEDNLLASVYTELRGDDGYIGMLAVDPKLQRSGLGRRMAEAAENHLRSLGCKAVRITVLSLRPELLPLYRKMGFVEIGTEPMHFARTIADGAECHSVVMSKPL